MEPPSMETVYQAISALYDNPNASEKEKASLWLGEVQKSIHSWKIADELLQQKKDVHSCYFASQTMRAKVQHNISELPSEAYVSLRDSLIRHLEVTSPDTSSAILTQLSLALVDLALQMPLWKNCVGDMIKCLSNKNDYALLEVLTVLPQEIDSSALKLGENRREEIKSELKQNAPLVSLFMKESITNSQSTHVALKIVKCMTSWIQVQAISLEEIPQNAVIGYCMNVLRDHNSINTLHDAAADCICALLHCLEKNNNTDTVERLLFDSISALEESYHMAVAHEEEEKAASYARVFTELAETFLEKIIATAASDGTHFAIRSLELALVCVGHHDYEVAEITFNLWYRVSEELYQRDCQQLTDKFKPHIERLIEALARHCQYEPDYTQLPEEGDEFYEFRMKVMELIKDVVFIVGSCSVFRQMFAALHSDISWEQTEAALFIMQAVAINILPDEQEYVPQVVEAIVSMPGDSHVAVRRTCLLLLGELCEWLERHPACLPAALRWLLAALPQPALATPAASALQSICASSRAQLAPLLPQLVSAARAADTGVLSLPPPASAALLRALASALGALPPHELAVAMCDAVSIQLSALSELIASETPPTRGGRGDPALWLDRLAALFRGPAPPAPCVPALQAAWPVCRAALHRYQADGRVMERACRTLRFALRCCGKLAAPVLPELVQSMAAIYAAHGHSCLLYLGSVLVDELAPTCTEQLVTMLRALAPPALRVLQAGVVDQPDTVDDFFRMSIRFLQRIPVEFLSSGAAPAVLQCAALAARLDHRDANTSVMRFLSDLTRRARRPPGAELASEVLTQYGGELTFALLDASVFHLHSYMLPEVGEVLLELVTFERARQGGGLGDAGGEGAWLRAALLRLPEKVAGPTPEQATAFYQQFIRAESSKDASRLLRDFAKLYR